MSQGTMLPSLERPGGGGGGGRSTVLQWMTQVKGGREGGGDASNMGEGKLKHLRKTWPHTDRHNVSRQEFIAGHLQPLPSSVHLWGGVAVTW